MPDDPKGSVNFSSQR